MLILFLLFATPGTSNTNLADAAFISKIDIINFWGANYCLWCDRRPKRLFKNVAISKLHFHQLHQTLPRARNIQIVSFRSRQELSIQRRPQDSGISTIFLIPSRWFTKGKAGSIYNRCFGAGRILNRRTRSQESLEVNAL